MNSFVDVLVIECLWLSRQFTLGDLDGLPLWWNGKQVGLYHRSHSITGGEAQSAASIPSQQPTSTPNNQSLISSSGQTRAASKRASYNAENTANNGDQHESQRFENPLEMNKLPVLPPPYPSSATTTFFITPTTIAPYQPSPLATTTPMPGDTARSSVVPTSSAVPMGIWSHSASPHGRSL